MEAARLILDNKISKLIVIGDDSVRKKIKSKNTSLLEVIDPKNYKDIERIAAEYYELRKLKGMTLEEAHKTVLTDYLTFGAMLVKEEIADGFVAGVTRVGEILSSHVPVRKADTNELPDGLTILPRG